MGIRVGEITKYKFVSLTDVYNECLKDPSYFIKMVKAVEPVSTATGAVSERIKEMAIKELAGVVLSRNHVLAHKCFDSLYNALTKPKRVELAKTCLGKNWNWARMWAYWKKEGALRSDCPWPDCPDSAT